MIREFIISMRPQQWYKNFVVFIALIFSFNFLNLELWFPAILAFLLFSSTSGSQYILNDILDRKKDQNHPKKRHRPIASGKLNPTFALVSSIVVIIISLYISTYINLYFALLLTGYFLLTFLYSIYLKEFAIVDILIISTGFMIRAIAGSMAISVFDISPWLIICAFLLALFLALGKRRHELTTLKDNAGNHRKSLKSYSVAGIDQMTTITATILITAYTLYTFLTGRMLLMLTLPLIMYCLFRYIHLVQGGKFGGEIEAIFKQKGIIASMLLWILIVVIIMTF